MAISDNWDIQKVKMLKKFSVLTEDDLRFRSGDRDGMLEKLQIKLGKNKEELDEIITNL